MSPHWTRKGRTPRKESGDGGGSVRWDRCEQAELVVAARPGGERMTLTNDRAGIKRLVGRLGELKPRLVVVEATGGLQRQVVAALWTAGIAVAFFLMKSRFFKVRLASPELRVRDSSGGSGDAMRGHFCNGSISVRQELRRPRGVGRPR